MAADQLSKKLQSFVVNILALTIKIKKPFSNFDCNNHYIIYIIQYFTVKTVN